MEKFDIPKKNDMEKLCCLDLNSSVKAEKYQTDNTYLSLAEIQGCESSSKCYNYMGFFVVRTNDNKLLTAIAGDSGYEPMLIYRDYLINELNFTLKNDYGLTNMVAEYTYHGDSYVLEYDELCNGIYLSVDIKDEKIPKRFFETVSFLEKIDVKIPSADFSF